MIISEKQIMQLMHYVECHIRNLMLDNEVPKENILGIEIFLQKILQQQSEELKEIE